MTDDKGPRPAVGHMPFPGHRTMETIINQERDAKHRWRQKLWLGKAMEYGFDPENLKALG